jgi:hypothetical protein
LSSHDPWMLTTRDSRVRGSYGCTRVHGSARGRAQSAPEERVDAARMRRREERMYIKRLPLPLPLPPIEKSKS